MLVGRFEGVSRRPYLRGHLLIPRLHIDAVIWFCVDTGADNTTLMPGDGNNIGVDYSILNKSDQSMGISGAIDSYKERAILAVTDQGSIIHGYDIGLTIIGPDPEKPGINRLPSLLGRDILNRWTMHYSPTTDSLTFEIVTADVTIESN